MKRLFFVFLTGFILPLTLTAQQDSIDAFISREMKEQGIMGLSAGIVQNGKIILAKGYGQANIELRVPATAETVYKIGSLSKQFIGVAMMKLVQEGKLKLSDPVKKFIKDAPDSWSKITLRHLLQHTSGLPAEPPGFDGMKEVPDSIYIKAAFNEQLSYPTGSKYEYSNFGYFVLADIIRIASGIPFAQFMKKNIFEASALNSTDVTSVSAIIHDRAAGYAKNADNQIVNAVNYPALRPSGAFLSNIQDLLKWEVEMQNNKLLPANSWNLMWNDTIATPFTMDNEVIHYTYGWMTNLVNRKQLVHHGGSLPGFKSVYFRFLKDKSAIIILTNADNADTYAIAFGIADLLKL